MSHHQQQQQQSAHTHGNAMHPTRRSQSRHRCTLTHICRNALHRAQGCVQGLITTHAPLVVKPVRRTGYIIHTSMLSSLCDASALQLERRDRVPCNPMAAPSHRLPCNNGHIQHNQWPCWWSWAQTRRHADAGCRACLKCVIWFWHCLEPAVSGATSSNSSTASYPRFSKARICRKHRHQQISFLVCVQRMGPSRRI